jgi:hypothetical protein
MNVVRMGRVLRAGIVCMVVGIVSLAAVDAIAAMAKVSKPFMGVKANTGTVSFTKEGKDFVLTLSDDFKVPDAPAPHWQIVDTKGNVYLLQRLVAKGEKFHKQIVLPSYIHDIARVQIWCAYAEVLLGETTFDSPIALK